MASKSPQSKYDRAHALVDAFLVEHRGRAMPDHWGYLGHLLWCAARRDTSFQYAVLRVACFHLAKQAMTHALPHLTIKAED